MLSAVWTVQHNIQKPIVPIPGSIPIPDPDSVQCECAITLITVQPKKDSN